MKIAYIFLLLISQIALTQSQYIIRVWMNNRYNTEKFVNVSKGATNIEVNFSITALISGDTSHKYETGMSATVIETGCFSYVNSTTDRQSVYDLYTFMSCNFAGPINEDYTYFIEVQPHVIDIKNWNITNTWYLAISFRVEKQEEGGGGGIVGIIVGSVAGGLVFVGIVAFLFVIFLRKRRATALKNPLLNQDQNYQKDRQQRQNQSLVTNSQKENQQQQ